jgi:NAD(P)-dependent dehydrogenase (short-subunit alcohol dehydrogenase family)
MAIARHALVTGGANGIGAAICRQLARDGMLVTFCDRDAAGGSALAAEIGASFAQIDVTEEQVVASWLQVAGPFDVLVNNAGMDQHAFFTDTDRAEWRRLLAINLETTFAFTHAVLPHMQKSRYGRIVNIASEAGRVGSKGAAVYAAAKAGVLGFSRSIARENARFGITVNAVLPGPIHTPMVEKAIESFGEKVRTELENLTLLRRLGTPEEVAAVVGFLASPASSFITGEAIGVSGGMGCGAG